MPPKAGPKSANLTETEKMLLSVLKMSDTKAVSWDKVHKFMGTESTIGAIKQRCEFLTSHFSHINNQAVRTF